VDINVGNFDYLFFSSFAYNEVEVFAKSLEEEPFGTDDMTAGYTAYGFKDNNLNMDFRKVDGDV
jgi:hypothetical protein